MCKEEKEYKKPPIGLMPRYIYDEKCDWIRVENILSAMERYSEADKVIPIEWIKELRDRLLSE